jgi:DNA-binding NarL/FixJ family response regulator
VGTVKNHVHHILQKLEPSSRYRLIAWVHRHDLLQHLPSPDDKS